MRRHRFSDEAEVSFHGNAAVLVGIVLVGVDEAVHGIDGLACAFLQRLAVEQVSEEHR